VWVGNGDRRTDGVVLAHGLGDLQLGAYSVDGADQDGEFVVSGLFEVKGAAETTNLCICS
jgi:hypothetical protein